MVPEPCACSTSMCVHDLSAAHAFAMTWGLVWSLLHVLLLLLDLLWRGWVTRPLFFASCFLSGLGFAWALAFPFVIQPLPPPWVGWHFYHAAPLLLPCYYLTCTCWASFGPAVHFPFSQFLWLGTTVVLVLILFWGFVRLFYSYGHPWPASFL